MANIPTLYTPRLRLRPFSLLDAERVQSLCADRRIAATTMNIPHPYPDGAAAQWIRSHEALAADGRSFAFAVTLAGTRTPGREHDPTDTGHLIGTMGCGFSDRHREIGELGYWIGPAYWNKGFATEAARAVADFAFARRGAQRVFARHFAGNPASGRVMKKIGMTYEGTLRRHMCKDATYHDVACYGILREEWAALGRRKKPDAKPQLQTA